MSTAEDGGHDLLGKGRFLELRVSPPTPSGAYGWEYAHRRASRGVVAIVAITDDEQLLLVEQHRPPVGRNVIELPAGLVGDLAGSPDEEFRAAAERELLEETGYAAERLDLLGVGPTSPGLTDERVHIFRASGLRRAGRGGGDETESIVVHTVALAGLRGFLAERERAGRFVEARIYAGLWLAGVAP